MKLDPTQAMDWEIAEAAEESMVPFMQLGRQLGLEDDELIPMGRRVGKVDYVRAMKRLRDSKRGRYIDVTAITPTPLGEGKTTVAMGLVQGLGHLGKKVAGTIRQPSGGPTFNIKGSAAGGGLAQCIPLTELSLGLTGDIDSITNAHNLGMVALTARMQHENNYDDERLARIGLRRLDVDPERVEMKWVMDFCAQSLRNIRIGRGGKMDGYKMDSGFNISVSSELMAILALCRNLRDMRERISKIVVAYDRSGQEITTADLKVDGAMTAWMIRAFNPSLLQTLEGQPVFVHAGPFANIAIGQSSILADRLALKLADYVVTESGFGADIGFEKFWNVKCRYSGLKPDAVVIVATVRALKMHGGGPRVKSSGRLDAAYSTENLELLERGCANLKAHIRIVRRSGANPVVCINSFHTDTDKEHDLIRRIAEEQGARCAVSHHWKQGGKGATELAETVLAACDEENDFKPLYSTTDPLRKQVETIAVRVYGASGVSWSEKALERIRALEADPRTRDMATCMA
ncbi:MAG: formate--tetrahydrofolate ligase, partial [Rhodothermales bacterium]|nr:formate--tetrahydrofolate ligase [Rhodothermales bacterium]